MELSFKSEFAEISIDPEKRLVFHVWKKACDHEDYRNPVEHSLDLLGKNPGFAFVVDARNGFEDHPDDVDWGFNYFLPEMEKTGCKKWVFITEKACTIEGELDMWSAEINKYFQVIMTDSFENALRLLENRVIIVEGLPATGKSTVSRKIAESNVRDNDAFRNE